MRNWNAVSWRSTISRRRSSRSARCGPTSTLFTDRSLEAALAVAKPAFGADLGLANPHAAIAAAYALVFAPTSVAGEDWERQVLELADNRTDIPDGKILEATLLLQRRVREFFYAGRRFPPPATERRLQEAWEAVQEALRRGPPVFRLGLQLLESNLRILRDADALQADSAAIDAAVRMTSWFRARVDPLQPLCVFDVD